MKKNSFVTLQRKGVKKVKQKVNAKWLRGIQRIKNTRRRLRKKSHLKRKKEGCLEVLIKRINSRSALLAVIVKMIASKRKTGSLARIRLMKRKKREKS